MGELGLERPTAKRGAVELAGVQAQGCGSREAVRTRGRAGQPRDQEWDEGLRPGAGRVATGSSGRPERGWLAGARGVVSGGQGGEAAAGESELRGGLRRVQRVWAETFEPMADEGRRVTMNEWWVFFKGGQAARRLVCTVRFFVGHRFARPPHRRAVQARRVLFC